MPEIYPQESLINIENDGWQSLDWHDWRLATRDKELSQYLEKQAKDAIDWYCQVTGETIEGYERSKKLLDYEKETIEKINIAIEAYKIHVDEESGLIGSENFARKYMMYRGDISEDKIQELYKAWSDKEAAEKAVLEPAVHV